MVCSRCGNELREDDRVCMFCGELNPNHPANKNFTGDFNQSFNPINEQPANQIEQLDLSIPVESNNKDINNKSDIKSIIIFSVVNIIYLILVYMLLKNIAFTLISCFYTICFELLLKKANLYWWTIFIPIYNIYILCKLAFSTNTFFYILLSYICLLISFFLLMLFGASSSLVLSIAYILFKLLSILTKIICIFPAIYIISLGRRFNVSWFIILLFGVIIIPDIAFSKKYQYQ